MRLLQSCDHQSFTLRRLPSAISAYLFAAACGVACGADDQNILPSNLDVQQLATGFQFTEGPAWDGKGAVYFSDIPNQKLLRWSEANGVQVFKNLEGSCNGLRFDADGNLLVCQPTGRQLLKIAPDGTESTVVATYDGKRLNSPNDLWIAPNGGIYFTDPRYGSQEGLEQDGFHVYYISPDGNVRRILNNLVKPNGVVGTADGKQLYVADPGDQKTYVYEIHEDGSLSNRRLAAPTGSDGLTLDEQGNLYVTGRAIRIFSPDAEEIGQIPLPESASNLTFGGADGRTLFITARTSLYAVKLNVRSGAGDKSTQ